MSSTNPHTLTFSGVLPSDEMDRAAVFAANPAIAKARKELENAFEKAGFPHASVSHVTRPRARKAVVEVDTQVDEEGEEGEDL